MRADPIIVRKLPGGRISVESPYLFKDHIKSLKGRRWNPDTKRWELPESQLPALTALCERTGMFLKVLMPVPPVTPKKQGSESAEWLLEFERMQVDSRKAVTKLNIGILRPPVRSARCARKAFLPTCVGYRCTCPVGSKPYRDDD